MSSPKEKLVIWLCKPHDKLSLEDAIKIGDTMDISIHIVCSKYIAYHKSINTPLEDIRLELLKYFQTIKDDDIDKINPQKAIPSENIKYSLLFMKPYFEKKKNNSIQNNNIVHTGYPENHIVNGRPHINWRECYYKDCHATFLTTADMKKHLESNKVLHHAFHSSHENIKLSFDDIINSNIKTCPSIVCDTKYFDSPDALIDHLTLLGIQPFWQPNQEKNITLAKKESVFNPVHTEKTCSICMENIPFMLFQECCHHVCCFQCYLQYIPSNCSLCRAKITSVIPF